MQEFENWVERNQGALIEDCLGLFRDSLKCLKNQIIRPAYLLAYQGMLVALKTKILEGPQPDGFKDAEWNKIKNDLSDDNKWDENTYDRIVQKAKADGSRPAVLSMSENVRSEFQHWRQLRNVCAHYKDFNFKVAHVVTLYSFIQSNLLKISVEGGFAKLLTEFRDYCDPAKHAQSESLLPLIQKISSMVDPKDYKDFIKESLKAVAKSRNRRSIECLENILSLDGEENIAVKDAALSLIKENDELQEKVIDKHPEHISLFLTDPVEIRTFWTQQLIHTNNPLTILAEMLEAKMIPDDQIPELFNLVLNYGYKHGSLRMYNVSRQSIDQLIIPGYFDFFVDKYISEKFLNNSSRFSEICHNTNFFIEHLDVAPITKTLVSRLTDIFCGQKLVPYTLRDRIRDELWAEEEFKAEFKDVAEKNGITIPDRFLK